MVPPISPWEFWERTLKSPRCVLAPMVDASELPWRLLSRKYGAQLAYTPMLNAGIFIRDQRYRKEHLETCEEDRPLIVQFCANDPDIFLQACKMVEAHCDAVDLNLGCPQAIAKKGHYGSFLQDEWDLISRMVGLIHKELSIPITCKVRVFESIDKSVAYAKMLEKSGCYALTVHGRTREQKGPLTGLASWKHIQAVKAAVSIPVIANGNIQYMADVERCILSTGVDAVMTAEGNLNNPALFAGIQPLAWDVAEEYLDLAERYPVHIGFVRGHLFKMFYHCLTLEECVAYREALAKGWSLGEFREAVRNIKDYFMPYVNGEKTWAPPSDHYTANLKMPPWHCQPYVRMAPEEHLKKMELIEAESKRKHLDAEGQQPDQGEEAMSKSKRKKLAKLERKLAFKPKQPRFERGPEMCSNASTKCPNFPGVKCKHVLCKTCCRQKCEAEHLSCETHNVKPKRVEADDGSKTAQSEEAKTAPSVPVQV